MEEFFTKIPISDLKEWRKCPKIGLKSGGTASILKAENDNVNSFMPTSNIEEKDVSVTP